MILNCTTLYLPFLCKALNYLPTVLAQCITCVDDDGKPVAGVVYDGYNGASISAHIWVDADRTPSKEWYAAIFDYPFNRLHVKKLLGQVDSLNEDARRLDEHLGFELEATVSGVFENSDMLIYSMTREQCRVLNNPLWAKAVSNLKGAA